jgi:prepilin peptidase CpaA
MSSEINLFFMIILSALVVWAMITDVKSYRIPNAVNLAIILLYPAAFLISDAPLNWQNALLGFVIIFAVGFALFALNIMGGGDVKMLSAVALWVEYGMELGNFLMLMALVGGVLTIFLLSARKFVPYLMLKFNKDAVKISKVLTYGAPIPYGVAIGFSFLWLLWSGNFAIGRHG